MEPNSEDFTPPIAPPPVPEIGGAARRPPFPMITLIVMSVILIAIFVGQQFMDKEPPKTEGARFGNGTTQLELMLQGKALLFQDKLLKLAAQGNPGVPVPHQDPFDQIKPSVRDGAASRAMAALRLYLDPDDVPTALGELDDLDKELEDGEDAVHALVRKEIETPGMLTEDEQSTLRYQMYWFSRLLFLSRADPNHPERGTLTGQSVAVFAYGVTVMLAAFAAFFVGIALLCTAYYKSHRGTLNLAFNPETNHGTAYLWAFILFIAIMSLQFVLIVFGNVMPLAGVAIFGGSFVGALVSAFLMTSGTFKERRFAMGLHCGRGIFREIGSGIVGYCAIIPIAILGGILSAILFALVWLSGFGSSEPVAGHPIQDLFFDAPIGARISLLLLASVAAPLIEETMFRGLLYRGLRRWMSGLVSGLLMGIAFAMVHPQLFVALPVLAALGLGFGLLREWRDSLIAPMIAHGLHNGILITGLWLMVL